ncbi:GPI mannosyltransferase 1 [Cimex lectularius]|uniref:GPI alpha-1,4-mannosyltransferase I, catalytic subunit n=1 Tax=Cimex lectularius TaxID=79782 RepID=A0A8I6SVC3_CIMLE|nr:GPI mannosyltransferase 1 [Cimex lectularius]
MDSLYVHLFFGFTIRVIFITYGIIQDSISEVQFTDIDYKVFTDAARNIIKGGSPYDTATYRYPPLIAVLMIPNVLYHPCFGKILLSFIDLAVYYLLCRILALQGLTKERSKRFALVWLYNPLSIVITTRGNADSVSAFFVILTLYFFNRKWFSWAGVVHGIAVHIRLYPIVFSLPLYISIIDSHENKFIQMLFPNKSRILFVASCALAFAGQTGLCYLLYGYEFLYESFLYHLTRIDIRHNYSVYFYLNYLNYGSDPILVNKVITLLPIVVLLLALAYFYSTPRHLAFCEMSMAFVLVMFNSVVTCQYFIWYLSLLPLCLPKMTCSWKELFLVSNFWFASQAAWLLPAYLLEFKSMDTYLYIWIQCLVFFWANVIVLTSFIRSYDVKKVKSK